MAITQAMCTLFKKDLMLGDQHLDSDTLHIALYTSSATLDATTDGYITANEVASGGGYTTGGNALVSNLDFGGDFTVAGGTFKIVFPANTASNAIVRID
jgi:hypothetical protein